MGNYNALINKSYSFKREVQGPSSIDYRSTPPNGSLIKSQKKKSQQGSYSRSRISVTHVSNIVVPMGPAVVNKE